MRRANPCCCRTARDFIFASNPLQALPGRCATALAAAIGTLLPLANSDAPAADPALVAMLIAVAALRRRESRGGHFRSDFPDARDFDNSHYTCVQWRGGRFNITTKPVVFTRVKPGQSLLDKEIAA